MTADSLSRRNLLKLGGAATAALALPAATRAAGAAVKRVLFFTKSSGYEHSVVRRAEGELSHAERILVALGQEHGLAVEPSKDGRLFDGDLDQFDAFVFYTSGDLTQAGTDGQPAMSAAGKQALLDAVAAGKGFVGSHCASDTFHTAGDPFQNQDRKDPYIEMLGGEFIRHGKQQSAQMTVVDPRFPGMKAAGEGFAMHEEWYSLKNFADDLHVLLVNQTEGMEGKDYQRPPYPATWARRHGQGRVFYTSMGHREDVWTNPLFHSILVGALQWTLGDAPAEVPPNLKETTPEAHVMPPR